MMNNSLIIIPCNVPWDWSTDYINQTARILGKTNTVICLFWIDARSIKEHIVGKERYPIFFRSLEQGAIGYHAIHFLPFRRFPFISRLNLVINIFIVQLYCWVLSTQQQFQKRILWFFDPICYPIIKLFPTSWFRVYDCIDYFRGNPLLTPKQRKEFITHENILIRIADMVTVNSETLYLIHSRIRKDIHIVPQGFRLDMFQHNKSQKINLPKDKPIIGYIGALNGRLDYRLLSEVAKRLPHYRFVFVGPLQEEHTPIGKRWLLYAKRHLFVLPNVTVIYGVKKKEIKNIIAQFSIGMIPYKDDMEFNTYCYPMKLFEYFYMGKPVISTPIEELKRFPRFVKIGRTAKEWENSITKLLSKPWPLGIQKEQKKLAIENSWKRKIEAIASSII